MKEISVLGMEKDVIIMGQTIETHEVRALTLPALEIQAGTTTTTEAKQGLVFGLRLKTDK